MSERPSFAGAEKRFVGHVLSLWDGLPCVAGVPTQASLSSANVARFDSHTFTVAIGRHEHEDRIVRSCAALDDALGHSAAGRLVVDVLPSAIDRGLSLCRAAAEMRKPIADVGQFTNRHGLHVYYRAVFLPLARDDGEVGGVLGAFTYKAVN